MYGTVNSLMASPAAFGRWRRGRAAGMIDSFNFEVWQGARLVTKIVPA
jgi:hypothetical protein